MLNLKNIKLFLLDLDGTLYLGNEVFDNAPETVERLRALGGEICYLTNNSSRSTTEYLLRLENMGFGIYENELYSSTLATIEYLQNSGRDDNVYLLATESVREEFRGSGIKLLDFTENEKLFSHAGLMGSNTTVVVAFDTTLTYGNLSTACRLISNGAHYVATHPDLVCPTPGGFIPDVGSFMRLIESATNGRTPDIICGKPYEHMAECIMNRYNLMPMEICMIGDRLSTDMQFAVDNGFASVLVLSGETTRAMYQKTVMEVDLVLPSFADMNNYLNILR